MSSRSRCTSRLRLATGNAHSTPYSQAYMNLSMEPYPMTIVSFKLRELMRGVTCESLCGRHDQSQTLMIVVQ